MGATNSLADFLNIGLLGPLLHTVIDFWRMVCQEKTPVIIMLCNTVEGHRVRCQQYWPSSGSQNYGPFTVTLEREQRLADYIQRSFTIKVLGFVFTKILRNQCLLLYMRLRMESKSSLYSIVYCHNVAWCLPNLCSGNCKFKYLCTNFMLSYYIT